MLEVLKRILEGRHIALTVHIAVLAGRAEIKDEIPTQLPLLSQLSVISRWLRFQPGNFKVS